MINLYCDEQGAILNHLFEITPYFQYSHTFCYLSVQILTVKCTQRPEKLCDSTLISDGGKY